jgi:hypothetical protein
MNQNPANCIDSVWLTWKQVTFLIKRGRTIKIICQIKSNIKGSIVVINDKQYELGGIEDVVNLKKELIESAQAYLK